MSVRTQDTATVTVDAEIERRTVLNNCLVERRQQDVRLVAHLGNRYDQKTVLLARVTPYKRGAMVCAGLIGTQHLFRQRLVEIDQQIFVKLQITHIFRILMYFRFKSPGVGDPYVSYSKINKLCIITTSARFDNMPVYESWFILPKLTSFFEPSKFSGNNYYKYAQ